MELVGGRLLPYLAWDDTQIHFGRKLDSMGMWHG